MCQKALENYNGNHIFTNMKFYKKSPDHTFEVYEENHNQYMYEDSDIELLCSNKFNILEKHSNDSIFNIFFQYLK